jgi:hypothetical protein
MQTAQRYGWERRIDELERFFEGIAEHGTARPLGHGART